MKLFLFLLFFGLILLPFRLDAAMEGGNFEIYADSFSVVQDQLTSNGTLLLTNTAGDSFATSTAGGNITLSGGFQAMERSSLSVILDSGTIALGQLSLNSVSSGSVAMTVTTDSTTGYTVSATEDGNLRKGNGGANDDIDDVSDGVVTAGSEEYGMVTSGGGGLLAADTAIAGTLSVASSNSQVTGQVTTITCKAAISTHSRAGSYSHIVTFTATANP